MTTRTEDLTAQVNGLASLFIVGDTMVPGTLCVFLNGQRLRAGAGNDFVETGPTTFATATVPDLGDTLGVQYETESTETGYPLVVAYPSDPGF
jgi:hypothetical protein